jgi:hypothetical protein
MSDISKSTALKEDKDFNEIDNINYTDFMRTGMDTNQIVKVFIQNQVFSTPFFSSTFGCQPVSFFIL